MATAESYAFEMRGIGKSIAGVDILRGVDLAARNGEILALLGPSGSGKSTILKITAGFFEADAGTVLLAGQNVNGVPSYRRNLGMVFQDYSLFPHMSVFDNVGFGLTIRRRPRSEIRDRVATVLRLVRLPDVGERFPAQLSGGQKQRIAVARALVVNPAVLLCDEPLSNLDAKLRKELQLEFKAIQRQTGVTFIYVTHDQEEAVTLADRVALLNNGQIEQVAEARDVFEHPRTRFAAEFMGYSNFLEGRIEGRRPGGIVLRLAQDVVVELAADEPVSHGSRATVCIREERIRVAGKNGPQRHASAGDAVIGGLVSELVYTGGSYVVTADCGEGLRLKSRIPVQDFIATDVAVGTPVDLLLPKQALRLLAGGS
jgi:putative spermidine/putrescine transport system ATP-binding protein